MQACCESQDHLLLSFPCSHSQVLSPTYKQRNEDFRKLFKKLPDSERLIVGEWDRDVSKSRRLNALRHLSLSVEVDLLNCWNDSWYERLCLNPLTPCLSLCRPSDYSCALQKDILLQGRLYLSENWLCFYSNIFRWETTVSHARTVYTLARAPSNTRRL